MHKKNFIASTCDYLLLKCTIQIIENETGSFQKLLETQPHSFGGYFVECRCWIIFGFVTFFVWCHRFDASGYIIAQITFYERKTNIESRCSWQQESQLSPFIIYYSARNSANDTNHSKRQQIWRHKKKPKNSHSKTNKKKIKRIGQYLIINFNASVVFFSRWSDFVVVHIVLLFVSSQEFHAYFTKCL